MAASSKKQIISWSLYDWANSAFGTIILTFVYSVYFTKSVAPDETLGSTWWSYAIAASGLIVALLAPVLGAIADYGGHAKRWLAGLILLCLTMTGLLFFGTPDASSYMILGILVCVCLANIGLELGFVFYNAFLPQVAPANIMGRVSGWAWALGYAGGLLSLVLCLVLLTGLGETLQPLFGLPTENALHIRSSTVLVVIWFALFSLPLFMFVRDTPPLVPHAKQAVVKGLQQLKRTCLSVRSEKNMVLFLIASALYRDGLATLFALGGIYAASTYDMDFADILVFAVGLNVTAGLGAFAFAFLDDTIGARKTILLSLAGLIICGIVILFAPDKGLFIALSLVLGIFTGPVQAASRSYAGRIAPEGIVTQIYGLYAFAGKSIAFLGPLLYGLSTDIFDTQKAGLVSILCFWSLGFALLTRTKNI